MAESRVRRPPRGHFDLPRKRSNVTAHRSRVRRPRAGISTRAIASLTKVTQMVAGTTPPRGHFDGRTGGQGSSCLMSRVRRPRAGISTGCHLPRRRTPHRSRVRRPRAGISTWVVVTGYTAFWSRVRRPRAGISTEAAVEVAGAGDPSRVRRPRAGISTRPPAGSAGPRPSRGYDAPARAFRLYERPAARSTAAVAGTTPPRGHFDLAALVELAPPTRRGYDAPARAFRRPRSPTCAPAATRSRVRRPRAGISTARSGEAAVSCDVG